MKDKANLTSVWGNPECLNNKFKYGSAMCLRSMLLHALAEVMITDHGTFSLIFFLGLTTAVEVT